MTSFCEQDVLAEEIETRYNPAGISIRLIESVKGPSNIRHFLRLAFFKRSGLNLILMPHRQLFEIFCIFVLEY